MIPFLPYRIARTSCGVMVIVNVRGDIVRNTIRYTAERNRRLEGRIGEINNSNTSHGALILLVSLFLSKKRYPTAIWLPVVYRENSCFHLIQMYDISAV